MLLILVENKLLSLGWLTATNMSMRSTNRYVDERRCKMDNHDEAIISRIAVCSEKKKVSFRNNRRTHCDPTITNILNYLLTYLLTYPVEQSPS
jgi:hypothetical protein